jgi:hypothetical protein
MAVTGSTKGVKRLGDPDGFCYGIEPFGNDPQCKIRGIGTMRFQMSNATRSTLFAP